MPQSLLVAYARMQPRLQAQEDMRLMNVMAAAAGTMTDQHRKKLIRRLTNEAGFREERPRTGDPWGLGIPVVVEVTDG